MFEFFFVYYHEAQSGKSKKKKNREILSGFRDTSQKMQEYNINISKFAENTRFAAFFKIYQII